MIRMLEGKWALVTGAGPGLGFALAESLAEAGANIFLHDLAEQPVAREALEAKFAVQAVSVAADLRERSAIEAMMADVLGSCGTLDILVNNAVVRNFAAVEDFAPEKWDEALAVNLSAPFHLTRLVLPGMKQRGWGRIINMASIYSTRAIENRIGYVTTKTALLGLTRAVAVENARTGITCNALCPGTLPTPAIEGRIAAIASNQNQSIEAATTDYLADRQPSGRFVSLQSVGAAAVFLCSPAASDITGATLPIDGGWSAI
jgi:3-hydroxybutyrate dehydrogenase